MKPQLTPEFPRELGPLGIVQFCCFLLPVFEKAPKLSAHSNVSEIGGKAHFRALHVHYPSGQVDKPPGLWRSKGTDSPPLHVSVFSLPQFPSHMKQRLLLAAREGWAQAAHPHSCVTTSASASKAWATLPLIHQTPTEGTILGADFLPFTTSGHPESPLIHHQPSLQGGRFFEDWRSYPWLLQAVKLHLFSLPCYSTALKALQQRFACNLLYSLHIASPGDHRPTQHGASPPRDSSRRSCHGMVLPFAIHELALTTLLQSQEIC